MACTLQGNVNLIVLKAGVTRTYVNENEKQPRGLVKKINTL